MKKILSTLVLCGLFVAGSAQDMFKYNDKTFSLDSKINIDKSHHLFGDKSSNDFTTINDTNKKDRPFIKRGMFNMYIDWNLFSGSTKHDDMFNVSRAGFTWGGGMYFTFGARIFDYVFVGAGFGSEIIPSIYSSYDYFHYDYVGGFFNIPYFVNIRGFFPITSKIYPYVDIAVGPSMLFYLDEFDDFALCPIATTLRFGVGVDFSRFSLGLGYEGVFGYYEYEVLNAFYLDSYMRERVEINTAYLKLGIRIGRME